MSAEEERFNISVISYLNAAPLAYSMLYEDVPPGVSVLHHAPSQSADMLASGRADAAMIPSVEFLRIPDLVALDGMAICSPGPVRSVVLVGDRPLEEMRRIGVTAHSRTSVALLKVLMADLTPEPPPSYEVFDDLDGALGRFHGVLAIGDPAMTRDFAGFRVFDLAEMWKRMTGLPFVFAFWAVRRERYCERLHSYLSRSLKNGLADLGRIVRDYSERLCIPREEVFRYLTVNLSFRLGDEEKESLGRFYGLCLRHGLAPSADPPIWQRNPSGVFP